MHRSLATKKEHATTRMSTFITSSISLAMSMHRSKNHLQKENIYIKKRHINISIDVRINQC